jgi:hypothetical protein
MEIRITFNLPGIVLFLRAVYRLYLRGPPLY